MWQKVARTFDGTDICVEIGDTPRMYCHAMDPKLEEYCGCWVAVGDTGVVVADGDSLTDLHRRLDSVAPVYTSSFGASRLSMIRCSWARQRKVGGPVDSAYAVPPERFRPMTDWRRG